MPILGDLPNDFVKSRERNEEHRSELYNLAPAETSSPAFQLKDAGKRLSTKVHQLAVQEQLSEGAFAAQKQLSEEEVLQVRVGDLFYLTERVFVKALNKHLAERGAAEGGFFYISEAAARVKRLRKKGKTAKADKFQEHLDSFATEFGISANTFNQWQAVYDCKDLRDRKGYLVEGRDFNRVQNALATNSATLEPCKDAVSAMISIGKRFNLL